MADGEQGLAVREQAAVDRRTAAVDYTREQIDTIKRTVAKGATDADLALFIEVCRSRGLDPFTRQVHWTTKGIICGIDGFRAIADRTHRYVPGPTRYETDDKGGLVAAHVTVRKLVAGQWFDLEESAYLSEYRGTTPIWREKPRVMLAKCAEARALRRAFPADLSGLYAPEEMEDVRAPTPPASSRQSPASRAAPAPKANDVTDAEYVAMPADDATGEVAVSFEVRKLLEALVGATTQKELTAVAGEINAARRRGDVTDDERASILVPAYKARRSEVAS